MRSPLPRFLAALLLAALASACAAAPAPEADRAEGTVATVEIPFGRGSNRIHVSPGEDLVVVECAGPGPFLAAIDREGRFLATRLGFVRAFDFGAVGAPALAVDGYEFRLVDPSTLFTTATLEPGAGGQLGMHGVRALRVPSRDAWWVYSWEFVQEIRGTPPAAGRRLWTGPLRPDAAALDDATGLAVLLDRDQSRLGLLEPGLDVAPEILDLPAGRARFDVAARGGRAWIALEDGLVLPFDVAERRFLEPFRVADGGRVSLALSGSGKILVTAAEPPPEAGPADLRVWSLEDGVPRLIARRLLPLETALNDIAVVESAGTVLLAGRPTLRWTWEPSPAGR